MASTRSVMLAGHASKNYGLSGRTKTVATMHQDVIAHHISVKDLIDSGIIHAGDQVWFKDQTAVLQPTGNISFKGIEFTSLSKWAKHVASALGLTKHYNGWKVTLHKPSQRPMGQFRDKYYAEHAGLPYSFPPLESKKRKKPTPRLMSDTTVRRRVTQTRASSSRITSLSRSRSHSEDSESNTSSHNGEDQELEEWPVPPPRVSQRKRHLRTQDVYVALDDTGLLTDSEEEWYDSSHSGSMIGEVDSTPCGEPGCYVCEHLNPTFATHFPTWADILQLALYSLGNIRNNDKLFFSLGEEIYPFIDRHWYKLCSKPRNSSWRQTAKMTLAHARYAELFENGYDQLLKTGFWRLKHANRETIEQLSAGSASSGRGTPHGSALAPSSTSPSPDMLKFTVPVAGFNGSRGMGSNSGDEQMSLLASLAAAEGTTDDLRAASSLSGLGTSTSKRFDASHSKSEHPAEDLDDYGALHAAERRRTLSNHFRSPTSLPHLDAPHQFRKEYQLLESKHKALEHDHRSSLAQIETLQSLLAASRRQEESTRLSFAQQAELHESQLRLLYDKVQRLEYELFQRSNSSTSQANLSSASSASPSSVSSTLPLLTSSNQGLSTAALMGMMSPGGSYPLYAGLPWLQTAGSLPPLGWSLDLNNNAAKIQLAHFQVQAQAQAQQAHHSHSASTVSATATSTSSQPSTLVQVTAPTPQPTEVKSEPKPDVSTSSMQCDTPAVAAEAPAASQSTPLLVASSSTAGSSSSSTTTQSAPISS